MPASEVPYLTLAGPGAASLLARRSRFFAYAAPAADSDEVGAWLADVRARHHEARHVPYAWIAPDGSSRMSDDGEPGGTGGRPCLGALGRHRLRGAAVAVARIYGGVQLGAANLGRAYGEAASAAVAAAGTVERRPERWVRLTVGYPDLDRAERALARAGARVTERGFGDAPSFGAWVPVDALDGLREALPRAAWA